MATVLSYTIFTLGDAQLHQLHTTNGKLFVLGEVAVEIFQESPTAFLQDIRKGKYSKLNSNNRDVLHTVAELGLPVESGPGSVSLLPAQAVEALLLDKRRLDLVQPFKLALLKLASQEAARLMAGGQYEVALPVAMDAVAQGTTLFRPAPALQLFPLYLLAAQANLGLRRAKHAEDFLALASWLVMRDPELTSNVMRCQLSRLYGQLYAFQGRPLEALQAFAEDVYYCALEYGPQDVRTSLGYYNLGKVFQARGEAQKAMACHDQVVAIWSTTLQNAVLEGSQVALPVGRLQLMEVVDMLLDVALFRASQLGDGHSGVAEAHMAAALALVQLGERERALEQLALTQDALPRDDSPFCQLLVAVQEAANMLPM